MKNMDYRYETISISKFLKDYILPYLGTELSEEKLYIFEKEASHKDLDELGIPGVKRIDDKDRKQYSFSEVIAVKGRGENHQGIETHYYLRPFDLLLNNDDCIDTMNSDGVLFTEDLAYVKKVAVKPPKKEKVEKVEEVQEERVSKKALKEKTLKKRRKKSENLNRLIKEGIEEYYG